MAETAQASGRIPTLAETRGWIGHRVDEMGGSSVARIQDVYVDQESGEPAWLVIKIGRFGKLTALPVRDCAGAAGHVWVAYPPDTIRVAPSIESGRPLAREQELEICADYGIVEGQGRVAEISGRPEGAVT